MTTARTHRRNVGRGGAARPRVAAPKPDDFTAVSAETFGVTEASFEEVEGSASLDLFDPADRTVDEVKAHVNEHPEDASLILELELDGKARSGLLSFLENLTESED